VTCSGVAGARLAWRYEGRERDVMERMGRNTVKGT
jgi:hypothetical protein